MKIPPVLGGTFIIAGTSIGAGMLGLPVVTGEGGFVPAIFIYIASWLFMMTTGLLLLEISLRMPKDSNLISMAGKYLGKFGTVFSWLLYLFLFYSLSVAYISGGGDLIRDVLPVTHFFSYIIFLLILAPFVYFGARMVDSINRFLMFCLIATFLLFVIFGISSIEFEYLQHSNWSKSFLALPVIFASFAYQGVIPSLTYYLKKDAKKLRYSIVFGTLLTFVIYMIWEFLILGIVPPIGENSLQDALKSGLSAIQPLQYHTGYTILATLSRFFGFFTITTSFLGVTLGVFDFLSDGLKISKKGSNKILLAGLTFVPPFIVATLFPGLFLVALHYAGGVGCALLLGLIPILMVYSARYVKKENEPQSIQVKGGKILLFVLILFIVFELSIEVFKGYL
jgi:tyrosine-specific transport protein